MVLFVLLESSKAIWDGFPRVKRVWDGNRFGSYLHREKSHENPACISWQVKLTYEYNVSLRMGTMKSVYKTHLFLRAFFGIAYLPFLVSALIVVFNIFKGNVAHPFQNAFMIENSYDLCFFISYEVDDKILLIKHPLAPKKIVFFSDINFVEVDGEFRKWPRFYRGLNWINISLNNGNKIDIAWVKNHSQLANSLKTHQIENGS